jgi:pentatricopeptide repeat protein
MIQAYRIHEQWSEAWEIYKEMENTGVAPIEYTFSATLSVLAEMTNLQEGQRIHQKLKVRG